MGSAVRTRHVTGVLQSRCRLVASGAGWPCTCVRPPRCFVSRSVEIAVSLCVGRPPSCCVSYFFSKTILLTAVRRAFSKGGCVAHFVIETRTQNVAAVPTAQNLRREGLSEECGLWHAIQAVCTTRVAQHRIPCLNAIHLIANVPLP